MSAPITAADLFCGAGGTSTGLMAAAAKLGRRVDLTAVNHWSTAIETHAANHPAARHLCESLDDIDPRKLFPKGLDILMASPECTHHSIARGGKPMSDQSRATAWHVLRWADALQPREILIENVREMVDWGPLDEKTGRPIESKRGAIFRAFMAALRAIGYRARHQVLNCADYGDATTRQRLFIRATRIGRSAAYPVASHSQRPDLFGSAAWRSAREIIDWSLPGSSIFSRKKPLAPKTLARIEEGLRRFGGAEFVLGQQSCAAPRTVGEPLPTVATAGAISLVQPFLVVLRNNCHASSLDRPLGTVTCSGAHFGLAQPFLVAMEHGGGVRDIERPLPTITTAKGGAFGVCEPVVGGQYVLDILFRMLTPRELASAMSFPAGYRFAGTREDVVRQIGNAVPCRTAQALCATMIESLGVAV